VSITINPVNDAPSFTAGSNVAVAQNSGVYSAIWPTNISAGPANESSQTLTFEVTNNNNSLFSVQPAIASNGTLSFRPAPNANGSANVLVTLKDNGGTANNGIDRSSTRAFTITVTPVNNPPTIVLAAGGSCSPTSVKGTLNLTVADLEGGPLTLSASSSNTPMVPNANIVFGGSGSNRTVTITAVPASTIRTATVTITVSDGLNTASTTITVVVGTTGNNAALNGTSGADLILALGGNDILNGLAGNDILCAGAGNDVVSGGDNDDTLDGDLGNDVLSGGNGNDSLSGGDNNDALNGENGNDSLSGGNGNDALNGGANNDSLSGGNDNDALTGGSGGDFFSGGPGSDSNADFNAGQGDTRDGT
jgi:Ca2+-binding RTX toxin-like protein